MDHVPTVPARRAGLALALLIVAATLAVPGEPGLAQGNPGGYRGFGDPGGFLNIVPPGQDGVLNGAETILGQAAATLPAHVGDQLAMYGDLVYNTPGLEESELLDFYKDASFGVKPEDVGRIYRPTDDVTVVRDRTFGVPHIYGQTRYATMFAQGYTGAEDRLFLMDVLRHLGRARLSEFLGASPANMHMDRDQLAVAPYTEAELTEQLRAAANVTPEGPVGIGDVNAYVDGVNEYIGEALANPLKLPGEYAALQQLPAQWKPEDVVATASLVGGIFGKGGGGEVGNLCGLKAMTKKLGSATAARRVFDDLHFANDLEAPTSSHRRAPYNTNLGPVNPAAHPDIDCATLQPIGDGAPDVVGVAGAAVGALPIPPAPRVRTVDAPWGKIPLSFSTGMSNALLVAAKHTKANHPIAVFGPQTGYFIPQLLVEKDVHGPGIDARGVAFAGTDIYVQLGRGRDYAFSATSAGGDNVDQWVLKICDPGGGEATTESEGYVHDGRCHPIDVHQHTQVAKPTAGGVPEGPDVLLSWRVERTEHYGPILARGTLVDGTPIAVASLRSTYRAELASARGFQNLNNPDYMRGGFRSFRRAMGAGVDYTFNWFYVDDTDIGYQHSCKCPIRARGVDPYLPAWGTGRWDWRGFLPLRAQPWDLNPPAGFLSSWNNKQAPGFMANDGDYSKGPVYRSLSLDHRIRAAIRRGKIDRADLVDAMEDAGTVDIRGEDVLPAILRVMGTSAPAGVDPRTRTMRTRLAAWQGPAAHRRDRDHDGAYDDGVAPAIMDAWWPLLAHAIFDPRSGDAIDNLGIGLHDAPQLHVGSAFNGSFYGQVQKDLRQVLGGPVRSRWSRTYCGGGNRTSCRALLWRSLADAAAALEAEFGSADVADWIRTVADDEVRHSAVGVTGVPAIHWINRPTFQQVVQLGSF